jgi:hypothetical protein
MDGLCQLINSSLGWRFNDGNFQIINKRDFDDIIVYNKEDSIQRWIQITHEQKFHLMELSEKFLNKFKKIETIKLEWGDEKSNNVEKLLSIQCLSHYDTIEYLYGGCITIKLIWEIFIKYWDDFCYPDDDTILIYCETKGIMMTFVEEYLSIYKQS